jgi:hypothetical protein
MENWLRRNCFEQRRRKRKSADVENWLRRNCFAPGNGCLFLFLISQLSDKQQKQVWFGKKFQKQKELAYSQHPS